MNNYQFLDAARYIQHEFKSWFCDKWIEEYKKSIQNGDTEIIKKGIFILEQFLSMLHPFCPYITDEIKSYFYTN
jgi:valyl-tRNA synthetase